MSYATAVGNGMARGGAQMARANSVDSYINKKKKRSIDGAPPPNLTGTPLEIHEKLQSSLESTRRMLNMCDEAQEAGVKTLVQLDQQGEQLDRVEEGMDQINQDMREAEKNLTGMEKCCGLFVCPCMKGEDIEKSKEYADTWKKDKDGVVSGQPVVRVGDDRNGMGPTGGYITRITNDAREDEMEENIGQVAGMVGNLRNMAIDMGGEIDTQNKQLDSINQKGKLVSSRIETANVRANKLLKD